MRHRSLLIITTAAVAAGSLTLSACGSRGEDSGKSGGEKTVTIGLDAPLTGDLSALGQGIKNSAELAVKTANKEKTVEGVKFKLDPQDDAAQPSAGQQNANKFVADDKVVGAVGPLNSNVGQSMQKVFDKAKMVEVSPANTAPELTQGTAWRSGKKERPFETYFRICTTDAIQGPYAAQYMYNEKKLKKVFVIDDKKTYGKGLAGTFKTEFEDLGGKVVGTDHVDPKEKDFTAVANKVAKAKPDFVYYGGEYPAGAPLADQSKQAGLKGPVVGGDALFSAEYIKLAKKNSEGDIASSVGAPLETLDSAKEFVKNYKAEGYKLPYEAYGGYAYDSTWAIIQAVKAVAEDNDGKLPEDMNETREKVVEAMQGVKFDGVSGKVGFDKYGDTTNKQLSLYEVKKGEHKPVKTGTFQD
ncbi:branched-chain amino acid ABC transporter substrate-binding protein [Streptomyces winkii]|uniref:branched-chain amino acid ABC transporter substrate-binding protein n=1 Tax=Streptomyces winkii TaxID=3051178 RepID=UPI0028D4537C|nr:branched-chain amino acid ABC transporter substrate-binding protein [Streptomyces sp. DSM 40971]